MKLVYMLLSFSLFVSSTSVWALADYTKLSDCGSARLAAGDSCKTASVEIDFKGCEQNLSPQLAKKIVCEGSKMKARFQEGEYRYEATLTKSADDNWGNKSTWVVSGPVKQWKKLSAQPPVATIAPPPPTNAPVVTSAVVPTTAPVVTPEIAAPTAAVSPVRNPTTEAVSALKFSGYTDIRYTSFVSPSNLTVANAHAESGFALEDGALYLNYDQGKVSALVDIAFRRQKDSDINPAAAIPNKSSNANLAIGMDKSQVLLRYKALDNLNVVIGQFDTLYGVELNDSKDRVFGKTGIVYDYTLPVTHTGAMLEFSNYGFSAKVFAANPNNKGTYGTSTSGDDNTEYGTAVGFANENYRAQIGYMTRPILKANGITLADRTLIDVTAGITFGLFSFDLEYAAVNDPNKNTLTSTDNTDREKAGTGLLGLATFKIIDAVLLGVRYETIENDPTAGSIEKIQSYGISGHYRLSPDLQFRSEYIGYAFKNLANVQWDDTRFNVAALFSF